MGENKIMPNGWAVASVQDIAEVVMGQSPPSATYNTDKIGLPFFQGKAEFTQLHPVAEKWCSKPNRIAISDDILLSVRAPVGATNVADRECCIGRGLAAVRYHHNHKFIYFFLCLIERELDEQGTGTTFRAISGEVIRNTRLLLPPLSEQHRIVAKIEELFSSLDKGIESLKTAQQQLKVYRQAVLKWAFEGKLTNKNVKEDELPAGWKWVNLDELCEVKDGTHDTPKYIEKGIPFVTQKNVKESGLTFDNVQYITESDHDKFFKRSNVMYGDILISMIGANRGMCCIVNDKRIFSIKNVGLVKANNENIFTSYLLYYLKSINAKNYVKSLSKGGAQEFIGLTELRRFPIIFAPIPEQHAIVAEIESRLSVCDKIEETIEQSLKQSESLRQSILKKAFEGKLVPQDPNEEPASVLLARIKAEREQNKPENQPRRQTIKTRTKKAKS